MRLLQGGRPVIGNLGIYHDHAQRVQLRPLTWLSQDLRDHHLIARGSRLIRRWRRI